MTAPLVSIITVTLNAGNDLEKTIQSVLHQSYSPIEYLIIDGGSSDNTLTTIQKYDKKIHYWHSQKDKGIYDAMNQGIINAQGDALLMLNAGDWLTPDAIEKMVDCAQGQINDKILACNWQLFHKNSPTIHFHQASFNFHKTVGLCHQGVLIGKNIYTQFGPYDDSLRFLGDYDYYLRVWRIKAGAFVHVPFYLTYYQYEGITTQNTLQSNRERWKVINRYFKWYEAIPIRVVTLLAIVFRTFVYYLSISTKRRRDAKNIGK